MGGQITGSKTWDTVLLAAVAAGAIVATGGAATPAVVAGEGALAGGAAAGAGAGLGAEAGLLTGAELGSLTASSGAGLGLTGAELGAGFTGGAAPGSLLLPEITKAAPLSSSLPSANQLMTGAVATNMGKQLFFPPTPTLTGAPGPILPASGGTRAYTPVATAPAQQLAQLMAARRQASAQRRFA